MPRARRERSEHKMSTSELANMLEKAFWETLDDDAKVYNFAYGANLSESSIKQRKLEPIESVSGPRAIALGVRATKHVY
jgi:hypothetical protein